MFVYRVEHKIHKRGPYCHTYYSDKDVKLSRFSEKLGEVHGWSSVDNNGEYTHVPYFGDTSLQITKSKKWRAGFSNLDKLRHWFDGWERRLDKEGFIIQVYEAKNIQFCPSKKQLIFNVRGARYSHIISITARF